MRCKSNIEKEILEKISNYTSINKYLTKSKSFVYYRSTGGLHYRAFSTFPTHSRKEVSISFYDNNIAAIICAVLSSNLWNMYYYAVSNCLDVAQYDILSFPIGLDKMSKSIKEKIIIIAEKLSKDIKKNSESIIRHYATIGDVICYQFNMRKSKPIIDEIDKVLAQHYGFTEEEIDFIINYDIKYRMGDELNDK